MKMVKEKKIIRILSIVLFIISIIAIIVGFSGTYSLFNGQQFALTGETVKIPTYLSAKCDPRVDGTHLKRVEKDLTTDPTLFSCTTQEARTYIPLYNQVNCEYEVGDFSFLTAYICDVDYDKYGNLIGGKPDIKNIADDNRCTKSRGVFSFTTDSTPTFTVNSGDYLYLDADLGQATLFARYPSYGLNVETSTGFDYDQTLSCEVRSLSNPTYHTLDKGDRAFVLPGQPLNLIDGKINAESYRIVSISEIRNGETIFISQVGKYQLIKSTEDGTKYVDTQGQEYSSNAIECIPGTLGCTFDAKLVKIEQTSCQDNQIGFNPVPGDNTKVCYYDCVDGKIQITNNCQEIRKDPCPVDKPLWDTRSGQCVALQDDNTPPDQQGSYVWLWTLILGLGGLFVASYLTKK